MQTVEVSYELREYVDYVIASQAYVPLDGFPYGVILKIFHQKTINFGNW